MHYKYIYIWISDILWVFSWYYYKDMSNGRGGEEPTTAHPQWMRHIILPSYSPPSQVGFEIDVLSPEPQPSAAET